MVISFVKLYAVFVALSVTAITQSFTKEMTLSFTNKNMSYE